jgi:hypothetical protein
MVKKYFPKKILEHFDNKKWDKSDKVYGIYNKKNEIVYIGKCCDIDKRFKQHKNKYNPMEYYIKELKKGDDENVNWEIVYIKWYSLVYKLDNKLHKFKENKSFIKYEYNPKIKDYYSYEYMYLNPYIQRLDIIDSKCISRILKKCITGTL